MRLSSPPDPDIPVLEEQRICPECNSGSRLSNGVCLNCLLRGALNDDAAPTGREEFNEVLAAVKSRDGDWAIGDHEILDEIARGGMGVIYRAREPHSGRVVALKCILAYQGDSDQAVARFRREAETAARLDHPNIVPIYHVGETADGSPFFTMKYAPNGSLLQARGLLRQQPRESVALMAKVAQAVQYAHEQGVLHRDLKPGNILLDGRGEPLVSDFGLARCEEIGSHLTRSLTSFGTPGYIAPEQANGPATQLTTAADIYSLGAILFELLAGRPPFLGDNSFNVVKQSGEKAAPKLRTLASHLDRDLETICARCLERDPSSRYRSAGDLAQDLLNWLADRPIIARPVGLWLRSRRWVRNNRRLAALLTAFCILGAGSLIRQIRAQKLQADMRESVLTARSVIVLPFLDLDDLAPDSSLAQSVAASLRGHLDTLGPARVRTGTALVWGKPEDIRKAAQEAKSRTVLTGTVRNVQGRKRISFRLVDAATGDILFAELWEESQERKPEEVPTKGASQSIYEILSADDWAVLMQSRMDPGLRNEEAREAMKAGRAWMSRYTVADVDQAITLFQKAIVAEPGSYLAHSYLAIAATSRTHYVADPKFLELGKTEAQMALELSPQSVDAHRALAGVYYQEGKFREALEEELRTIEIGGVEEKITTFVGMTLRALGSPHQALSWYRLSSNLQGTPGEADTGIGDSWADLYDDDQALRAYDRAIELRPGSSQGVLGKCRIQLLQGNFDAAREICRSRLGNRSELGDMAQIAAQIEFFARNFPAAEELYSRLATGDVNGGGLFYGAITYHSALGRIRQALGGDEAATTLLKDCLVKETAALDRQPGNPEAAYRLAAVEASLSMTEVSLRHLRQAVASGWVDYRSLQWDPRFDSLRSNPELPTIINELSAKVAGMRAKAKAKTK